MTTPHALEPLDPNQASQADLTALYELWTAAQAVDRPEADVTFPYDKWLAAVRQPSAGLGVRRVWVARCGGEVVAHSVAYFLDGDNDNVAVAAVTVPPDRRREGIGTAVLAALLPLLQAHGRTVVEGWDLTEGGSGHRWAEAVGLRTAKVTLQQVLRVAEVDPSRWDVPVPAGYRVEAWTGAAPAELVSSYARALQGMQDAPADESRYRKPQWSADRVRAAEAELRDRGVERRVVVAVHEATGEVVAVTQLDLYSAVPVSGYQRDTTVVRSHRGRNLGLCVKARMLRLLRTDRGEVERVETNTSADNEHMIRINHRIGYADARTTVGVSAEIGELSAVLGV